MKLGVCSKEACLAKLLAVTQLTKKCSEMFKNEKIQVRFTDGIIEQETIAKGMKVIVFRGIYA
jgi:hypothetical protein